MKLVDLSGNVRQQRLLFDEWRAPSVCLHIKENSEEESGSPPRILG